MGCVVRRDEASYVHEVLGPGELSRALVYGHVVLLLCCGGESVRTYRPPRAQSVVTRPAEVGHPESSSEDRPCGAPEEPAAT